jgi:hypothetical protein
LEIERIDFSEKFTQTLFVQFKPTGELKELSAVVARGLGRNSAFELNPHLSLLYQHLPNEEKAELARTILLSDKSIRFDAIKAIVSPSEIKSRADLESWRVVHEGRLGGGET